MDTPIFDQLFKEHYRLRAVEWRAFNDAMKNTRTKTESGQSWAKQQRDTTRAIMDDLIRLGGNPPW